MEAQRVNIPIQHAIQAFKNGKWPEGTESNQESSRLKKEMEKLMMKDGLLHRLSKRPSAEVRTQLVFSSQSFQVKKHGAEGHTRQSS